MKKKKTITSFFLEKQEIVFAAIILLRLYTSDIAIALERAGKYYPRQIAKEIKGFWLYPEQAIAWHWFGLFKKSWLRDEFHYSLDHSRYISVSGKEEQLTGRRDRAHAWKQDLISGQHKILDNQLERAKMLD